MSEREFELYLKLLSRCLGLTAAQREQIADELRDHLEERLEGLARAGVPRDQAVMQALDEFGDASVLANHFTSIAQLRRRRMVMRLSLGSVAALTIMLFAGLALWPDNKAVQGPARVIGETTAPDAPAADRPKVAVAQPIARDVTDFMEFVGITEPSQSVEIRSQVTGYLVKSLLPVGGAVKRGDVLFQIDDRRARADVVRAEAEAQRAEARAEVAKKAYELVKEANEKADKAVGLLTVQQRWLEWKEATAELSAARADVDIAQFDLSSTKLRAPVDGHLSRPTIDEGNLVMANSSQLGTLTSLDPLSVRFDMNENMFLDLRRAVRDGEIQQAEIPVAVALRGEREFSRTAKLATLDGESDNWQNVKMRATMQNPDQDLVAGLQCRVRVSQGAPYEGLLVPNGAVNASGLRGKGLVMVVDEDGKVEVRKVEVGPANGSFRAVREGMQPGDWVVSKFLDMWRDQVVDPIRTPVEP